MANAPKQSDAFTAAGVNAKAALCNSGYIRIYNGAKPTDANTAIGAQILLAELRFGATAFATATNGLATANSISAVTASATYTAQFFRCFKSDGTSVCFDGTVGTAGCDMNLNSTAIQTGASVSITSLTYTDSEG